MISRPKIWLPRERDRASVILTTPRFHDFAKFHRGLMKYQRGMLSGFGVKRAAWGGGGIVPLVTDIVIVHQVSPNTGALAGIVFNETTVGSVEELVKRKTIAGTYTVMGDDDAGSPVDHTGEWTDETAVASEWEVACTSEDTGSWDTSHAGVGSYTTFSTSDMNWYETRAGGKGYTAGTSQCIATFRIREVADTANNTDFEVDCSAIQDP